MTQDECLALICDELNKVEDVHILIFSEKLIIKDFLTNCNKKLGKNNRKEKTCIKSMWNY